MIYALDTNILNYLLQKNKQVEYAFQNALEHGNQYAIPPMVYYELKRWLTVKNKKLNRGNEHDRRRTNIRREIFCRAVER